MNIANTLKQFTILYVEDDFKTRQEVGDILKQFALELHIAPNGEEALKIFKTNSIDLVISDIDMPKMDGVSLARNIRKINNRVAIIMLTAFRTEEYLFNCVNLNIQAYIIKPISYNNLKNALLKTKNYLDMKQTILQISKAISYTETNGIIIKNGKQIPLKKKEILLMNILAKNCNSIVNYSQIECAVWEVDGEAMTNNALRTIIKNLRKKVGTNLIENISGIGYKLIIEHSVSKS